MTDVTIVVATHNRPAMLEVELESILAAAALVPEKVRVLVVDDASETDEARVITGRLGVDYMRLRKNRGVAGTLAAGFSDVDSTYYSFWGDDDFMLPNWFELHLEKIAEGRGFDVVASSYWLADADLNPTREVTLPVATLADLRQGHVRCNDGSLVRRSAVESIALRPERERAMMMTFWLAVAAAGRRFTVLEEPTWLYRRHGNNLSNELSDHDAELRAQAIAEYA